MSVEVFSLLKPAGQNRPMSRPFSRRSGTRMHIQAGAAMALLIDDPPTFSRASPASPPEPVYIGRGLDVAALIRRWHLVPAEFQVQEHELCEGAGFAPGGFLVTVANRRVRVSRTYLSRPLHADEWIRDFEQDLRAGVFSGGVRAVLKLR